MPEIKQDIRAATFVVAANNSVHKNMADYVCDGINDHIEIQAALDALPATGGEVKLLDGTYNCQVGCGRNISNITVRGCGRNTILTTSTADLIFLSFVGAPGAKLTGIVIADMQIDGGAGAVSDCGIYWEYVDYSFIQNVYSRRHASGTGSYTSGINLLNSDFNQIVNNTCLGNGIGISFLTSNHNTITSNTCQGNGLEGIILEASNNNAITSNTCQGNGRGVYLDISNHNTITSNTLRANSQGADNVEDDIFLTDSDYNNIQGNTCRSPIIATTLTVGEIAGATAIHVTDETGFEVGLGVVIDLGGADEEYARISAIAAGIITIPAPGLINAQAAAHTIAVPSVRYGINISNAASDGNLVTNNDLYDDGFGTGTLNDAGTGTVVKRNRGWLTENSNTATIAAAAVAVAVNHGLAATPTRVFVTPRLLSLSNKFWVTAIGAAQFTINVDVVPGAGTAIFDWKAQVGEG